MKLFYILIFVVIILGCSPKQDKDNENPDKRQYTEERNPVDIIILERTIFKKEMVSNGKLKAVRKSVLKFRLAEELEYLPVNNGDRVIKGQVIARLQQFDQKQKLNQAQIHLDKAHLELQDELIGRGYFPNDSLEVPENILNAARIRTGLASAENEMETARFNYESTILKAPFSGKIANLQYKIYEKISPGDDFCTLIDDSEFEVEFSVLETELQEISLDKEVKIIPFAIDTLVKGRVSEINPVVEENGLVKVKAVVRNPGMLIEGMNVKVLVENEAPGQLVVPKSAIVLRQNQEVLFKYTGGIAFWTYVQTVLENSDSYAVRTHPEKGGTLEPGDTVIVSGNLNLAHESNVLIK